MTAVVADRVLDCPVLVGDVVLSSPDGKERVDYAAKVYAIGKGGNVVIGWSGASQLAREAIGRLRRRFEDARHVSADDLGNALDALADLRAGRDKLELTGWIVGHGREPRVIRWASHFDPTRFCTDGCAIGDGGDELRRLLNPGTLRSGNSEGEQRVALATLSGFVEARFEETLRPDEAPTTWGGAFEMAVLQGDGRFRWLPDLMYVPWDLTVDARGTIIRVRQAPVVLKQQRVHDTLLLQQKQLGASEHAARASRPIDRDDDRAMFERRPFSARARFYAIYFRIFQNDKLLRKLTLVLDTPTRERGLMHHDGDEDQPSFRLNVPAVQVFVRALLQKEGVVSA